MNSDFFSRIPLVEILTKQCFSFWRDFSENDWKKQTYCEGWSPEDIVSHLVTGTEFYSYSIERAINNLLPEPPYGKDIDEFYSIRDIKGRQLMELSHELLLDRFVKSSNDLQSQMNKITTANSEQLGFHPRGLIPLGFWIGQRLFEIVLHDWDIRYGYDKDINLSVEGVKGILPFLPMQICRLFNRRENISFKGSFLFVLQNPRKKWIIQVSDDSAEESYDLKIDIDAKIEVDSENLILLLFGRESVEMVEQNNKLKIEGDRETTFKLLDILFAKY
ncbi:MAG: maleylpyruvate isomerase N-terminal domain-containing protein [bacterium]